METKIQVINLVFAAFLLISAITDVFYRKIFNTITFSAMLLGLVLNVADFGVKGLGDSLLGLLAGFGVLILFYLLGGIGAGDVKFMAAAGSLKGASFILVGGAYGAGISAIAALILLAQNRRLMPTLKDIFLSLFFFFAHKKRTHLIFKSDKPLYIPYAAFLALGLLIHLIEKP